MKFTPRPSAPGHEDGTEPKPGFLLAQALPRTASGKIQKHVLREWTVPASGEA